VNYPDRASEKRILIETTGAARAEPRQVLDARGLMEIQELVRLMPVGDSVVEDILDIVRAARPGEGPEELTRNIAWGPGPRASQSLMLACRARALLRGRLAPSKADVLALTGPVLKHRMSLNYAARADGDTVPAAIGRLLQRFS
jgi:MoxR-like ATPase